MGSFSWTRAEHKTERANLTLGDNYKILVPQEFGGGYIVDTYFDYGQVFYCGHEEAFNVWGESIPRCKAVYVDAEGHHFPAREFINTPDDNTMPKQPIRKPTRKKTLNTMAMKNLRICIVSSKTV